jgi:hypothetical protein
MAPCKIDRFNFPHDAQGDKHIAAGCFLVDGFVAVYPINLCASSCLRASVIDELSPHLLISATHIKHRRPDGGRFSA